MGMYACSCTYIYRYLHVSKGMDWHPSSIWKGIWHFEALPEAAWACPAACPPWKSLFGNIRTQPNIGKTSILRWVFDDSYVLRSRKTSKNSVSCRPQAVWQNPEKRCRNSFPQKRAWGLHGSNIFKSSRFLQSRPLASQTRWKTLKLHSRAGASTKTKIIHLLHPDFKRYKPF